MAANSGGLGSLLTGILGTGAQIYGQQNAAEDISKADTAAIGTQNATMGNISNVWGTQAALGKGADTALASTLGVGGKPADYSNFMNMPGYKFAVDQGTQAIQRQAAASGSAYTPNTGAAVGQYVTGTAMQDYNTYVSQLQQAAGLGSTANTGLATGFLNTGENISNLQQNSGMAQASGVAGASGAVGNALGGGVGNFLGGSVNGSGVGGLASGIGGLINKGVGALSNWWNSGSGGAPANIGNINAQNNPSVYDNSWGGGFDTMGGSTMDPNATGDMSGGYSPSDYGAPGF